MYTLLSIFRLLLNKIIDLNQIRSKRRDNFRHPSFSSSQNKINDQDEKQARTEMDLNPSKRKNGN